jgi:hypothetical protein
LVVKNKSDHEIQVTIEWTSAPGNKRKTGNKGTSEWSDWEIS